ncbi:MAG: MmcQ/YjbR family DNA-binding protein [Chloroflexota bacterium]
MSELDALLERLNHICMALPEASQDYGGVGHPSFKVREKIFAMQHPAQRPGHENRPSLWVKAPPGFQAMIVENDPEHFFVPPYVGVHGWVGIFLDIDPDWEMIADLVEDSYRMSAPKRLQAQMLLHP